MPTQPTAGRTLVTRRAVIDIVRTATLGSYGVTGFAAQPLERMLGWLGLGNPGIGVHLGEALDIELELTVAFGVPIAEVARQVDSAIRYSIRHGLGREVGKVTIHIDGVRFGPGGSPPTAIRPDTGAIGPRDLADSGTDVA